MDKVPTGVKCKRLSTEVTCKRPLITTSKITRSEVQDTPDRGEVQDSSEEDFEINRSEVQDIPNRGEVQDSSEEDFENK
jgi:hypothetical protein